METSGGRAFGSESIASAKALRQECAWCVRNSREQCGEAECDEGEVWGGE